MTTPSKSSLASEFGGGRRPRPLAAARVPDPAFGKQVRAKTGELDLPETVVAIDAALPNIPADPGEATLAVEALLAKAGAPMTAAAIARGFKRSGGRPRATLLEHKVAKALTTLVRYGRIAALDDARFVARKAA